MATFQMVSSVFRNGQPHKAKKIIVVVLGHGSAEVKPPCLALRENFSDCLGLRVYADYDSVGFRV